MSIGLVATMAELQEFYKGDGIGDILELMNQTNDVLTDVKWMEANQTEGHKTRIRTGLPEVSWRRLYRGTPPSKSQYAQVVEGCGMLEGRMELDVAEVEMYGDKAKQFRLSEGKAFAEAMRQKVALTMFYGDSNKNKDEFNGLSMRYSFKDAPNVIDAGGTTANKATSMWFVCWGDNTVHGIYPKGSQGGLQSQDLGSYMTIDGDGYKYQCVGDLFKWRCGLAVRDWRAVVRVCNIDTTKLHLRKGEEGFIDLQALTIKAKNLMPQGMRENAIWYCNQDVLTALEMQSSDAGNVHLNYGDYLNSSTVPALHGRPIRQCDVIATDEKLLTAKK